MAEQSEISWTHATHNEWIGCTRVSPGCQHCYAETLMDTRYGRVKWGKGQPRVLTSEANRRKPLSWDRAAAKAGTRTRVFSASLSDWLDHEVPAQWLAGLLSTVAATPNLDWLMLTKRPHLWRERVTGAFRCRDLSVGGAALADFWLKGVAPQNVWVGTTVEDQERADERVPQLLSIPARVRFLSCEPLLGPVKLARWLRDHAFDPVTATGHCMVCGGTADEPQHGGPDWIIAGGESGHGARPMHPAWARSLRDQATSAGVAFHFKQWGEWAPREQVRDHITDSTLIGPVASDGTWARWTDRSPGSPAYVARVGKAAAGRELDGREWNEFPVPT